MKRDGGEWVLGDRESQQEATRRWRAAALNPKESDIEWIRLRGETLEVKASREGARGDCRGKKESGEE